MVGVFTVVENGILKKYKNIIASAESQQECIPQDSEDDGENVLLFFSFDIVNSSLYKTVNYYGWSIVIDGILSSIRNYIKSKIKSAEVWRVLGDEIIFIVKICDKSVLFEYVEIIYETLVFFCSSIESGTLFEGMDEISDVVTELVKLQDVISLQSTAWIANVTDKKAIKGNKCKSKYIENVFEEIEENPRYKFYEFMGVDIDAGFRLSKETRAGRLAVSFELAYLMVLEKNGNYVKNLNIVSYRSLKGVWNNSAYPIIWYYDKEKHNNVTFSKSMSFDAIEQDDIYVEYFGKKKFADYMYRDVRGALKKVCKDRKLKNKIDNIERVIEKDASFNKQYINIARLELHCVAVCFNNFGKIFCVQRADNVSYMPLKWEFGCAKANYEECLSDTIVKEYKRDFNVDISLCTDNNRKDEQPIPIAVYTINKNSEMHKGVIFIANIISEDINLNSKKHVNYRFVGKEEIDSLNEDDYVPDAIDTMKKAFKLYEEVFQNEG